eukprot:gb/GEZN01007167.1/.p1 GENE.gb/GEZN01007167.1/~~gb/GEZN01007167.1/.p1  ORF type:complete len:386 (-),score=25.62 gb/GEZN01007167.1/:293-1450(-)
MHFPTQDKAAAAAGAEPLLKNENQERAHYDYSYVHTGTSGIRNSNPDLERGSRASSNQSDGSPLRFRTISQIIPEDRRVQEETCFYGTSRSILLSPQFGCFYVLMVVVGLFLLTWGIIFHADDLRKGDDDWFSYMDLFLSTLFLLEVSLRLIVMGQVYFDNCFNLLDLVLLPCALASSVLGIVWDDHDTVLGDTLLVFRYLVQVCRFVCILRHHSQQNGLINDQDKVDFGNMPTSRRSSRASFSGVSSFSRHFSTFGATKNGALDAWLQPDRPPVTASESETSSFRSDLLTPDTKSLVASAALDSSASVATNSLSCLANAAGAKPPDDSSMPSACVHNVSTAQSSASSLSLGAKSGINIVAPATIPTAPSKEWINGVTTTSTLAS